MQNNLNVTQKFELNKIFGAFLMRLKLVIVHLNV